MLYLKKRGIKLSKSILAGRKGKWATDSRVWLHKAFNLRDFPCPSQANNCSFCAIPTRQMTQNNTKINK